MTKKLLICLSALCMLSFSMRADDITGTYTGQLDVTVHITGEPEQADPITSDILLIQEDGKDTYMLSIKDFYFGVISVGDLEVTGLIKSEEDGFTTFTPENYSTADIPGLMSVYIYLGAAIIDSNGMLDMDLSVRSAPTGEPLSILIAEVTFNGEKQSTGIFNPKDNSLAIQISSDFSTIRTTDQSGNYSIFSTTGAIVQSGNVDNGNIAISNLKAGIYMIKVNNSIAKFIKK